MIILIACFNRKNKNRNNLNIKRLHRLVSEKNICQNDFHRNTFLEEFLKVVIRSQTILEKIYLFQIATKF